MDKVRKPSNSEFCLTENTWNYSKDTKWGAERRHKHYQTWEVRICRSARPLMLYLRTRLRSGECYDDYCPSVRRLCWNMGSKKPAWSRQQVWLCIGWGDIFLRNVGWLWTNCTVENLRPYLCWECRCCPHLSPCCSVPLIWFAMMC
jgi:hypothetical protein